MRVFVFSFHVNSTKHTIAPYTQVPGFPFLPARAFHIRNRGFALIECLTSPWQLLKANVAGFPSARLPFAAFVCLADDFEGCNNCKSSIFILKQKGRARIPSPSPS